MKKQLTTACLILLLVVSACLMMCIAVSAETVDGVYGDLSFSLDTETGILEISGNGAMPGSSAPWLAYRDVISSVTVNEGVTSIGQKAFENCTSLVSAELPDTLETIGNSAFKGSGILTVTIPEGVTTLATGAFSGCKNLESVSLPSTLATIEAQAFYKCSSLSEVEIPAGVTALAAQVFAECSSLAVVELPDTLAEIASMAFANCTALADVELPESLCRVYANAFSGCDALIETVNGLQYADNWVMGYDKTKSLTEAVVREGTVGIASAALKGADKIAWVYIPRELAYIGKNAFEGCTALKEVKIEDGSALASIGDKAFYGCSKLVNMALVKKISVGAGGDFELPVVPDESGETLVIFPERLTSIGVSAFEGCVGITRVVIPTGVTELADNVFRGCYSLETLTLPVLNKIGQQALYGCRSLETLYFLGDEAAYNAVVKASGWDSGAGEYAIEYHTAHEGGVSTCAKSANCSICGQWYGGRNTDAHGATELKGYVAPTCGADGYTGDYCCVNCGDVVTAGEAIPMTGNHTGGKATCVTLAACDVCGKEYGEIDASAHTGKTKVENKLDATCGEEGYTGDIHCADCGVLLTEGEIAPATGNHTGGEMDGDGNAVCSVCGETYKPYILGDVNGDKEVNTNDAVHCLRHILFPAKFEVNQNVDFTKDNVKDVNDAIYLLRHVLFPAKFPL